MFNAVPTYSALPEDDSAEVLGDHTAQSSSLHLFAPNGDAESPEPVTAVAAL